MTNKTQLKIGLIIADNMEFKPFAEYCAKIEKMREGVNRKNEFITICLRKGERTIELTGVKCGVGKVNAAMSASFQIANGANLILNSGLSGGIANVRRGDIVAGTQYMEADFDLTAMGMELARKPDQEYLYDADPLLLETVKRVCPDIVCGRLGTGDFFLNNEEKKNLYKNKFDLTAFDMETGAIASVCYKCDVPFLAIRKVSDDAAENSPEDYREMNNKAEASLIEVVSSLLDEIFAQDAFWK